MSDHMRHFVRDTSAPRIPHLGGSDLVRCRLDGIGPAPHDGNPAFQAQCGPCRLSRPQFTGRLRDFFSGRRNDLAVNFSGTRITKWNCIGILRHHYLTLKSSVRHRFELFGRAGTRSEMIEGRACRYLAGMAETVDRNTHRP